MEENTIFKRLEPVRFISVVFYDTPDSPVQWRGLAVQTKGDYMYGELILLKTEYINKESFCSDLYELGKPFICSEWEWNGGIDLEDDELEKAKELYNIYVAGGKLNEN